MAEVLRDRRPAAWIPWAALSAFFLVAMLYWAVRGAAPQEQAKLYEPRAQDILVVPFEGRLWVPADERLAMTVDDEEMVVVGEQVGVTVFSRPADGLGGGGGYGRMEAQGHRYYVKLDDDTYVPLDPQDQWAPQ